MYFKNKRGKIYILSLLYAKYYMLILSKHLMPATRQNNMQNKT